MAFFISGGSVSNHCTAAERSLCKIQERREELLQFLGRHIRERLVKIPVESCCHAGAAGRALILVEVDCTLGMVRRD